jgi:hexosaminidase
MLCLKRVKKVAIPLFLLSFSFPLVCPAATSSPLYGRGYTVIPAPQEVEFNGGDFEFGSGWRLQLGQGVKADDMAVESLKNGLAVRYGIILETRGRGKAVELAIRHGSVEIGEATDKNKPALEEQAYRLDLADNGTKITANAPTGLFYGVETLVQLVKQAEGKLWLPQATITDWPDLENRFIYWDDKAHLDRLEVLKETIRQASFYKINGIMIKLNGHFEFKSAPAVVEPYALSPAELQKLTNYGLKYHVRLIPYLDGPAHIAWILKHPEYRKLREFPQSNYELCSTNPDSYKMLEGMYQDLMDANRGVKYFLLSTDEAYYIGLANNDQCRSAERAKELGSPGRLLAEFVAKTAGYLRSHGRTVIFWGEYPLKPSDVPMLPSYLVNGEVYGPEFDHAFKAHGIKQMVFTYMQGNEDLFPNYYLLPPSGQFNYRLMTQADSAHYRPQRGRVSEMYHEISFWPARQDADLIGIDVCGWGDNGLHPETFWLGFATIAGWGWHPATPGPDEAMSSFYRLFYGYGAQGMGRVYQLMSTQAEFWTSSWDWAPSTARNPLFGNSRGLFKPERPGHDQTLPLPPVPRGEHLRLGYDWGKVNARRVTMAHESMPANDELLDLLHKNLRTVHFQKYNLRVFLSIAELYRQNLQMIVELDEINGALNRAQGAAAHVQYDHALAALDRALDIAEKIWDQRNRVLHSVTQTWYESWFPRVAEANGRRFLFELNSVHDYRVDRALGQRYLIEREFLLPLGQWFKQVEQVRNHYARAHHLPIRDRDFNWQDTTAGP